MTRISRGQKRQFGSLKERRSSVWSQRQVQGGRKNGVADGLKATNVWPEPFHFAATVNAAKHWHASTLWKLKCEVLNNIT